MNQALPEPRSRRDFHKLKYKPRKVRNQYPLIPVETPSGEKLERLVKRARRNAGNNIYSQDYQ